jgi:biopolymer transport protein ExbD
VKINSPVEEKRARIEIIPLIDIMFFLLACFMAISLSMIQMRGMGVNLPMAVNAQPELSKDFIAITIDVNADIFLEKELISDHQEIVRRLRQALEANKDLRVYIRADKDVNHGAVVNVLDLVRSAGVKKVAFELKAQTVAAPKTMPDDETAPPVPGAPPAPQ